MSNALERDPGLLGDRLGVHLQLNSQEDSVRSAYGIPSSPSSVWPGQRPAVGVFSTISGGTPRCTAISRTWVLYRSPIGRKSAPASPNFVAYPVRISLLFPVPMTTRSSVFAP